MKSAGNQNLFGFTGDFSILSSIFFHACVFFMAPGFPEHIPACTLWETRFTSFTELEYLKRTFTIRLHANHVVESMEEERPYLLLSHWTHHNKNKIKQPQVFPHFSGMCQQCSPMLSSLLRDQHDQQSHHTVQRNKCQIICAWAHTFFGWWADFLLCLRAHTHVCMLLPTWHFFIMSPQRENRFIWACVQTVDKSILCAGLKNNHNPELTTELEKETTEEG